MKKKHHEEHENLERWLVSYADFITLLFAFFTVLYALSMTDKAKYKNAIENIQKAFLSSGGIFPLKGTPFVPFEKPADRGSNAPPTPTDMGKFSKEEREALEKLTQSIRSLFERTTGSGVSRGEMDIIKTEGGFKIRLKDYLIFKPGSDKIKRDNLPFLYEMGKRLTQLGLPIQIEGHTDKAQGTTPDSNWQLSINRSFNIVRFLVEGTNFPPNRVSMAGYGDTQPISDNETPEGRQRNRRVEISIAAPNLKIHSLDWEP